MLLFLLLLNLSDIFNYSIEFSLVMRVLEEILSDSAAQVRRGLSVSQMNIFDCMYQQVIDEFHRDCRIAVAEHGEPAVESSPNRRLIEIPGADEESQTSQGGKELRYSVLRKKGSATTGKDFVSVFLPVKNGKHKVLRSLLGLVGELSALEECFDYEINVCLNNTTDGTIKKLLRFSHLKPWVPVNLYEFNLPSLRGAGKIEALSLLHSLLLKSADDPKKVFVHVADDDIGYDGRRCGIHSNLVELMNDAQLKVISGTYSYSSPTRGFHFLNSIRKDPDILRRVGPLPQVYGGALTMRLLDMPRFPPNTSFDCFISLWYLREALFCGSVDDLIANAQALTARTNPHFMVEHTEESSFARFVWRLLRDTAWRKKSVTDIGDDSIESQFLNLRRHLYDHITKEVERLPPEDPRKIGQIWHRGMRDQIYERVSKNSIDIDEVFSYCKLGISEDSWKYCSALVKNRSRLNGVQSVLADKNCIDDANKAALAKVGVTEKERLKIIEKVVVDSEVSLKKREWFGNPTLFLLDDIVRRSYEERAMLEDPAFVSMIFQRAGIALKGDVVIQRQQSLGNCNFSFFVHDQVSKYFLKYHDPLGFKWFQKFTPRQTTFYSTLCQQLFAELLGQDAVVPTLYPSLDVAFENYAGPQQVHPLERVAQRILIQNDLRGEYVELINHHDISLGVIDAVKIYASTLAEYHGRSLGAAKCFAQGSHRELRLMQLLFFAADDIRFSCADAYRSWLAGPNWVTRIFLGLEDGLKAGSNPTYSSMTGSLPIRNVREKLEYAIEESANKFAQIGCIGHLEFKMNNIFVNRIDPQRVKVYDFDYVTFVDPHYEAGHSLYSVVRRSVRDGLNPSDTLKLVEVFNQTYWERMRFHANGENVASERYHGVFDPRASNFFAALTLLSVFAAEHRLDAVYQAQVKVVADVCSALLE